MEYPRVWLLFRLPQTIPLLCVSVGIELTRRKNVELMNAHRRQEQRLSLEAKIATNERGSCITASSVHWPSGHLAPDDENISTTFNTSTCHSGDANFSSKVCRCEGEPLSSHGGSWQPKVRDVR
uniref:Uncharacterized protein n=2 Tax=Schistocephalus solidus TaxID=70667 RepID=A0A0X3PPI7_SCHSO